MFLKLALVAIAIIALMVVGRDQNWAERAGVAGSCAVTQPPAGERDENTWYVCTQGLLNGFPALEGDSCVSLGLVSHQEVWRCPAPLSSTSGY